MDARGIFKWREDRRPTNNALDGKGKLKKASKEICEVYASGRKTARHSHSSRNNRYPGLLCTGLECETSSNCTGRVHKRECRGR